MRKFAYLSLRVFAFIMLFGGVFLFFLFRYNVWVANIDHATSDAAMWNMLSYIALGVTINSIIVFALSYVVEAACKYLESKEDIEE